MGIYLRLSDEDRNKKNPEDDSESIKNQRNLLMDEIKRRADFVLVEEYCDEDLSGAGTYRPEFERLIKDCEKKKIDVVLCKSQSRFSRDMEIIEKYIHNKFVEWNIRFIGLVDNADTKNLGNKKARQINGLVNEWYLEDVSNNIRSAFQIKMKKGEYISPFAPYGYQISKDDNNKLEIDSDTSPIVQEIFELYEEENGFTRIANILNQRNIPSPALTKKQKGIKLNICTNKPVDEIKWSANAIKKILTNEIYIGNLVQGKRTTVSYKNHKIKNRKVEEWITVNNTHDPIINRDLFETVQKKIKEKRRIISKRKNIHKFCGKVFCMECNAVMKKKNSVKHSYLVCAKSQTEEKECGNKYSIRYDVLENLIQKEIHKKVETYFDEKEVLKELKKINQNQSLKLKQEELKKKYQENKNYLKSLYEDKVNQIITIEQFKELLKIYSKKEKEYQTLIEKIRQEEKSKKKIKEDLKKYKSLTLNRTIINELIEKIYIGKVENNTRIIQIEWKS